MAGPVSGACVAGMRALNGIRMPGLAAILATLLIATGAVQAAPDRQAVLVLGSYHAGFAWTDAQVEGITSVLEESRLRPEIFLEHLDVLRLPAPYDERGFADHLARRYRSQRFDLIIATDDAAVSFLARHQPSLFAATPVVFSDAAAFDATALPPGMAITGVMERIDIPSTLQVARHLRPRAAQVVVYANRADTGTGFDHARDVLGTLQTNIPIRISYDLQLEEIVASAAALSAADIVFVLASAHDAAGKRHGPTEVIARVSAASPAPLFDITSHRVRAGLTLGGKVEDGGEVGRLAARMAVRILEGEDARSIPVQQAPLAYVFNHGQMQRHGIEESELPAGSIVVGKPPTLYEQHRGTVRVTAGVVLALSLAVLLLVNNIRRRRGAERSLLASSTLINAISETQALYIAGAEPGVVFERMLSSLLAMTESEYGFIAEICRNEDGSPFLRPQAITNIACNDETRALYATQAPQGLEFRNLKTLVGAVMTTARPVIANDPDTDRRRHGRPPGHPPLHSFMGLPFFRGDELVGMVAVANRPGGYAEHLASQLAPFLNHCASLTEAVRENRRRRDAEAALRSNEERLRLALVAGNLGFYDLDLGTGKAVLSAEYASMLGYADGELELDATTWLERVHPDDRDLAGRTLQECIAGTRSEYQLEYRLQTRSGEWRWIQSVGRVVACDAQGRPLRLLGTHADISRRKQSEEMLELTSLSVEHASDAIFWLDGDGRFVHANEQACRSLGYTRAELLRLHLRDVDADRSEADWHESAPGAGVAASLRASTRHRRKDGSTFPVEVSSRTIAFGGRVYGFAFVRDVSARRRAEEAVRQSEQRLLQAIRVSGIGIFDHDHRAGTIYWSPELRAMFGWEADEPRSVDSFIEAVHPDDRGPALAAIQRAHDASGDGQYEAEYRIVGRSGVVRWVLAMGQTSFAGDGESRQPLRTVGAALEITARKQAEEALRRANEELDERVRLRTEELASSNAQLREALDTLRRAQDELIRSEKLASLGSLVAGVAHEMGTPLGNSLLVATTLSEKTRQFSQVAEGASLSRTALRDFVAVAMQATGLIERSLLQANDLIGHFKQVAVDQTSAQRRRFDLATTVAEIVATLQPQYRKTPHRLRVDIPEGIVMDSFPGPLGQVITNLATNALLHGFAQAAAGLLEIAVSQPRDGRLTMTVSDNGCGIAAQHLPRIFDPFFTTRLGQGGSGLGLHIVYSIATRVLGGRIEARSTPGTGTTFVLDLPLQAPDAQPAAATWGAVPR
ncbi:PAS domain S-box protein [Accumulibacter sp.]|uniref:PAS domain S-box protein n=1 Tax=Accumulibacter sp. TaxID=2053492 RepID=UPI0025FF59AA|nr:PAS domain S-box protein [Accumulibacter sp.]MCM8610665.1 PAS domain S-box protein [Accumulibacter sp.]MCM8634559.1 PAS domain S-box protein [Accumulibacter sp.]MCM8641905.1 PAS domain S-box protein [Accumulibacter sp.]